MSYGRAVDLSPETVVQADLGRWTLLADDGTPTGESWWDRLTTVGLRQPYDNYVLYPLRAYAPPAKELTPVETERATMERITQHVASRSRADLTIHPVALELWMTRDPLATDGWWRTTMPRLNGQRWPTWELVPNRHWPTDNDQHASSPCWWEVVGTLPEDAPIPWSHERDHLLAEHGVIW